MEPWHLFKVGFAR